MLIENTVTIYISQEDQPYGEMIEWLKNVAVTYSIATTPSLYDKFTLRDFHAKRFYKKFDIKLKP